MATYNKGLMNLEMELDNNMDTISNHNQTLSSVQSSIPTNFKPLHSQPQNSFGTEYLHLNGQSDLNYYETNIQG